MVLITIGLFKHPDVPRKKLIFLEKNKASWLVDEKDWQDIVESAEEVT